MILLYLIFILEAGTAYPIWIFFCVNLMLLTDFYHYKLRHTEIILSNLFSEHCESRHDIRFIYGFYQSNLINKRHYLLLFCTDKRKQCAMMG